MCGKSSYPITTRSGGPVPNVRDAASTPLPSQSSDPRPDRQFVMPETPEQPKRLSGSNNRIAVFTENGAIVMTSKSCQSLIEKAIRQGSQTHIADQVGGIFSARHQQKLHHFPWIYQLRWKIYQWKVLRSMICIRGIHGMVSIDCRLTPGTQTVHVLKLYIATVCSMKTKTAAQRLFVHLHATTLLVTTSQLTCLSRLELAFIQHSHSGQTHGLVPSLR